jgi:membrane-associated phospholipid phosphatase
LNRTSARTVALAGGLVLASFITDKGVRSFIQANRGKRGDWIASVGNRFGEPRLIVPLVGAAFLAGKLAGDDGVAGTSVKLAGAMVVAGAISQLVKFTVGRARPANSQNEVDWFQPFNRSDEFNSFPSGHTAVAFALASTLANQVHGKWARRLFYAGAVTTAFARINNDKHWISDVTGGALLGHFAGKLVTSKRIRITPRPDGVALAVTFR